MFEVETVRRNDRGQFPEPEGEIIEVFEPAGPGIEKLRFLVRVEPKPDPEEQENFEAAMEVETDDVYQDDDDEEMVVDPDELTPICGEPKSDGDPCTREVGADGEKCWQHSE